MHYCGGGTGCINSDRAGKIFSRRRAAKEESPPTSSCLPQRTSGTPPLQSKGVKITARPTPLVSGRSLVIDHQLSPPSAALPPLLYKAKEERPQDKPAPLVSERCLVIEHHPHSPPAALCPLLPEIYMNGWLAILDLFFQKRNDKDCSCYFLYRP